MTQRERSKQARRKWQKLISEQGRSGQTVAAFCRVRKLCVPHFFWWKKRLRVPAPAEFLEVKLAAAAPAACAVGDARVEVVLRNGRRLRVGPGFDRELVGTLATVLESVA